MSDPNDDKTVVLGGAAAPGSPAPTPQRKTSSDEALPIGTRLHEFEIVDLVGQGGFGIVYLADDHSLQRRVAIKEYMPSALATRGADASVIVRSERHTDTFEIGRRSFVNEARLLAQFDHPALLKVYRFWEANGTAYMAMPYYAGKTLRDTLRERQGQPPDEAWIRKILAPVMDALELMHSQNCFHRDVAPDNIMLLRDDRPVLLDFGAARRVISDMTQALTVILKPGYAPIEQYAEMPGIKQGPWTDIYALGAVVYFTITGRTPPPAVGRMMQDIYEPLAVIAAGRYSDQFLRGLDQCLRVRGEDRPQSIAEMRAVLGIDAGTAPTATTFAPGAVAGPAGEDQPLQTVAPSSIPATTHVSRIGTSPTPAAPPAAAAATAKQRSAVPLYVAGVAIAGAIAGGVFLFTRSPAPPAAQQAPATPAAAAPTQIAAPPVPITPAPAPRQPVPLDEAFAATVAGSDGTYALKAARVRTPLSIGQDPLTFVLNSQRNGLLYVLLWDKATGRVSQIFPNDLDRNNRIAAGKPLAFPRPDWAYEADQPKGDWEVMAIVSDAPRDFSGLGFESRDGSFGALQPALEAALGASAKGGAALGGEAKCTGAQACSPSYAAVRFTVEENAATPVASREIARPAPTAGKEKPKETALARDSRNEQAEKKYVKDLNKSLDQLLNDK